LSASKRVLGGRYELAAVIGEGGMATVYKATDTVLGRAVAVKVLAPRYATDATFVQRFRREAQNAAAMNHPSIVNVFDTGSDDDTHFIVMELVEGKTLRDVLADGPVLPERAAEIAEAVASALAFAHERGIVHRDVKPGNIMITPSGDVKVMDFGIARATAGESLTQTATVLGTATYLSPEQAQGESVDARSDLYSLGVVLYEMLSGRVPFEGESPVAVAYKHVREEPVRPSLLNPDIPEPLERVVLKAMAKNPQNRYASAADMRADLSRFLAGRPVEATPLLPPDATEIVTRQPREATGVLPAQAYEDERRPGRTAAIVVLVVVLLAALVIGLVFLAQNIIGTEPQVAVPDCVGGPISACRTLAEDRGLTVEVVRRDVSDRPAGTVLEQDPAPREMVDRGTTIDVVISRGAMLVPVPNVIGKHVDEARDELQDLGFTVFVDRQFNDEVEEDFVFAQDPEPGAKRAEGAPVQLTVSQGAETVVVPDLTGMTVDQARSTLEAEGLELGNVSEAFCVPPQDPGEVCTQDPQPGNEVPPGTAVNVTVQSQESSPTPTDSPTESPAA
jgi:serine/threonine-protein kinase